VRQIIAVILGAFIGSIILLLVGVIANTIKPTPPEFMDSATPEAVAQRVSSATMFTWISTIFGLALGSFFGSIIGAKIAKEKRVWVTSAIGLVLSLWAFYTFYIVYPEVLWVPITMFISAILFSYLGRILVSRTRQKNSPNK
jgi:magnesium-transporting ATPase (P-type)